MNPKLTQFLKDLKQYGIKENIPNVTETGGKFLNSIINIKKPKHILEIGCANGYSTLWMADAAKKVGADIKTIDFSKPTFNEAKENIKKMDFENLVDFTLGNALKVIPTLPDKKFDFVFIDGQKKSYLDFWTAIQPKLTDDPLIIFDDIMAFPEKTKPLMEAMNHVVNFEWVVLPIDKTDGILMVTKK